MYQSALQPTLAQTQTVAQWVFIVLAGALLMVGLALLATAVLAIVRHRGGPRQFFASLSSPAAGDESSPALQREIERIQALMADAQELSDRLAADLNAHATRLQSLVDVANARIARLEGLAAAQLATQPPARSPAPAAVPATRPVVVVPDRTPVTAPATGPAAHAAPAKTSQRAATVATAPASADAVAAEVYRLADAGLPVPEIAKRLGQHAGKVELILALRQP